MEPTVRLTDDGPGFWLLSDRQLAFGCLSIAQGRFPGTEPFLRAQALRVFLMWRGAIESERRTPADFERAAGSLAALRKRTVQILVRLTMAAAKRPDRAI